MTPAYEKAAPIPAEDRLWTKWRDKRPPNAAGVYRYRCRIKLLGIICTPEWSEKMTLCGMGYDESEWWPLSPCRWDGYRRYITHDGLEWSEAREGDANGIAWHGLDLLPCPFTGAEPIVTFSGCYIGAPVWFAEALWISSPRIPQQRWTDAAKMREVWNTRADQASQEENPRPAKTGGLETAVLRQPQEERIREKDDDTRLSLDVEWEERIREDERDALFLAAERAQRRHIRSWIGMRGGMFPADRARLRGDAS